MAQYEMRTMDGGRSYIHVPINDYQGQGATGLNHGRRVSVALNNEEDGCKSGVIVVRLTLFFIFLIITLIVNSSRSKSSSSSNYNSYGYVPPSQTLNVPADTRRAMEESLPENFPRVVDEERERMNGTICMTPTCINLADDILSFMDNTRDPCQDFYQYACGGWIRKHTPVPPGTYVWTPMSQMNLENRRIMKKVLDQKNASNFSKNVGSNSAEKKALNFYLSCMDPNGQRKKVGAQPLRDLFKNIDGWPTFAVVSQSKKSSFNKKTAHDDDSDEDDMAEVVDMDMRNWSFGRTLLKLVNYYGVGGGLIKWAVELDPRETSSNIIMIRHDALTPKDNIAKSRSTDDDDDDDDMSVFKNILSLLTYMEKIVKLTGISSSSEASKIVTDVFSFQSELAELVRSFKKTGGSLFHTMRVHDLQNKFGLISWLDLINNGLSRVNKKIYGMDYVLVQEPDLFVKLATFLKRKMATPAGKATLRNFMMWKIVWQMIPYMSTEFDPSHDIFETDFGDLEEWQSCLLDTDKYFGLVLGAMYRSEKDLGDKARAMSREMMTNIRQAFQDNLIHVSWLEMYVKPKVKAKADRIRSLIGYPDYLPRKDPHKFLDNFYSTLIINEDNLFHNVINAIQFKLKKNWAQFKVPSRQNQLWEMNPGKAAAHYYGGKNQVIIAAGILQKPFFDIGYPESVNYGALGMVMGHEVIHGFGDADSIFGRALSNLLGLPKSLTAGFDGRIKCLKDQYSFFKAKNKTLDLEKTLGENVADNGGLKMAYLAYKKKSKFYGDFFLPRLNFTHDQLFFVTAAQLWCSSGTEEGKAVHMAGDVHAPGELRVQIPIKNIPQFGTAFNCPWPGTMNPAHRCIVW